MVVPINTNKAWNELSDDILLDVVSEAYCRLARIHPEELDAQQELSERIEALCYTSEGRTRDNIFKIANEIAEKHDFICGLALPSISDAVIHTPVLARGTAFSHINYSVFRTEMEGRLHRQIRANIRNSWEQLGDRSIAIVDTTNGPMAYWEPHAGTRFRKFMDGFSARIDSHMTVEAELKAVDLLKTKITSAQFRSYILNGSFVERSKKSGLFYFFRKGLPIVVVSYHGKNSDGGKILCCLCLHPYGYYEFTHAGVMTPTDEVICQLLMMRADEHKLWKDSGQWSACDTRSGL